MADILFTYSINSSIHKVFEGVSTPKGLNGWWTKNSEGESKLGDIYRLNFGPDYNWSAIVSKYIEYSEFELEMADADIDWKGTKVGFELTATKIGETLVNFYHSGWLNPNDHFRISSFCWAMYLRLLKRNLEFREFVPYEDRRHS